jgi:hypothetical protein
MTPRHSALVGVRTTALMQRSGVPELEQRMEQLPGRSSVRQAG